MVINFKNIWTSLNLAESGIFITSLKVEFSANKFCQEFTQRCEQNKPIFILNGGTIECGLDAPQTKPKTSTKPYQGQADVGKVIMCQL